MVKPSPFGYKQVDSDRLKLGFEEGGIIQCYDHNGLQSGKVSGKDFDNIIIIACVPPDP